MAMLHITKENYQELVEQSAQPVPVSYTHLGKKAQPHDAYLLYHRPVYRGARADFNQLYRAGSRGQAA